MKYAKIEKKSKKQITQLVIGLAIRIRFMSDVYSAKDLADKVSINHRHAAHIYYPTDKNSMKDPERIPIGSLLKMMAQFNVLTPFLEQLKENTREKLHQELSPLRSAEYIEAVAVKDLNAKDLTGAAEQSVRSISAMLQLTNRFTQGDRTQTQRAEALNTSRQRVATIYGPGSDLASALRKPSQIWFDALALEGLSEQAVERVNYELKSQCQALDPGKLKGILAGRSDEFTRSQAKTLEYNLKHAPKISPSFTPPIGPSGP